MTKMARMVTCLVVLTIARAEAPRGQQASAEASPAPRDDRRPAVAVLDFDYGAVREQWGGAGRTVGSGRTAPPTLDTLNVGKGVADLLVAELVSSGVRLLERERLTDVAREREGGDEPRARYLLAGAVTQFGAEDKNHSASAFLLGLALARFHVPMAGLVSTKETYARVGLSCRVVDAATGEIVGTASGTGESRRKGLLLGGMVAGAGGHYSVGSSNFQGTILGEATADAVKDLGSKLTGLLARVISR